MLAMVSVYQAAGKDGKMRNVRIAVCLMVGVLAVVSTADAATLVGWGYDGYGQASPPSGNDYTAIAGGYYHGLALEGAIPEPATLSLLALGSLALVRRKRRA